MPPPEGKKTNKQKGTKNKHTVMSRMHVLPGMLRWVLQHMDDTDAELPKNSGPKNGGKGAMHLLLWVRRTEKNKDRFMSKIVDKLFASEAPKDKEEGGAGDACVTLVDEMIASFKKENSVS